MLRGRAKTIFVVLAICTVLALAAGSASAAVKNMLVGKEQCAVAVKPQSVMAAWSVFEKGGNAFDAIVAEQAVNGLCNASANMVCGADVQVNVYVAAEKRVYAIDGEGRAPMLATIDWYNKNNDGQIPISDGLLCGTVPGIVDTWCLLLDKWGTWTLTDCLAEAIKYAEQGWPDTSFPSGSKLAKYPSSVAAFDLNKDGSSKLKPYDLIKYPQVAVTLRKLCAAEQAALKAGGSRHDGLMAARDRFYKGDIAKEMGEFSEKNGGLFRYEDFAQYHARIWDPIYIDYKGYRVYSNTNASNGPTVLCWLNMLKNFDLKSMKHGSVEYLHTMIETGKLAYADRLWLGDLDYYPVPYKGLLSEEYGKDRAKLVDPKVASQVVRVGNPWPYQGQPTPPNPWGLTDANRAEGVTAQVATADLVDDSDWAEVHGDTSGVSCADKWGNVIVMTPSLHSGWGTGVAMGNLGFCFNCRGDYYYLDPTHPNALKGGEAPNSTLMTIMVCDSQNRPVMTVASPGGDDQPGIDAQCVVAFIDFGMTIQDAVESNRIDLNAFPSNVWPHTFYPAALGIDARLSRNEDLYQKLLSMGHKVTKSTSEYIGTQHAMAFDYSHPGYTVYMTGIQPGGNWGLAK